MGRVTSWWRSLWTDTLTKRLFLLLWGTLVLSHTLGFWFAHVHPESGVVPGLASVPVLPSVPPLPGWHDHDHDHDRDPDHGHSGHHDHDHGRGHGPDHDGGPPNLWLDYLVRLLVMGAAAWLGARWLTAPMRRLSQASEALAQALGRPVELPLMAEHEGPQEVRHTARVFNDMARQLRAQFDERGLLMAAVSHDLRTPLTRLRMRLEKLLPDPQAERCVQDVQDVNAIIEAVLEALREERQQEPAQAVDVLSLVHALADDLAEQGLAVSASGQEAMVRAQPVALKRVLDNLVNNALRYGHGARIGVALVPAPGDAPAQVHITVDDTGPGIPPDQLEAVFKPFVRLDASRQRDSGEAGGVGLGLYIARELTRRDGGQIMLRNRPEGGLQAELVYPLASA